MADVAGERRARPQIGDEHGQNEDRALGDRRVVRRHIEDQEDVDYHHQDVGAKDRTEGAAPPSAELRPADDDGRKHLEEHGVADQRIGRPSLRADEDAGQTVAGAADDEDHELHEARGHPNRARRIDVAADGIDRDAEIGPLEPRPRRQNQDDEQDRPGQDVWNGVAKQEVGQRRRNLSAGLVHNQEGHALQNEHRRERDDNRLHAQDGDEKSVEGARGHPDPDA